MSLRLQLRRPPGLRLDLRDLTPTALAPLSVAEVEKFAIAQGNRVVPLAEFFDVAKHAGDEDLLAFEGDLARCDRIGWQLAAGRVLVEGSVGDYAGACMSAGELTVRGNAGLLAACEMAGGSLRVNGNVGDFAASGLPGSVSATACGAARPSYTATRAPFWLRAWWPAPLHWPAARAHTWATACGAAASCSQGRHPKFPPPLCRP